MIILISGCLVSQLLYANTDNYKNILIGDQASTMAGAFSAISDDSSEVFYNPAELVHIPKTKYTGSANTYYQKTIVYENAIDDYNWERDSRTLKPNFFQWWLSKVSRLFGDCLMWFLTLMSKINNQYIMTWIVTQIIFLIIMMKIMQRLLVQVLVLN